MTTYGSAVMKSIITIIGIFAVLFVLNWHVAISIILMLGPVLIMWPIYTSVIKFFMLRYQKKKAEASSIANECIGNIRTIKAFSSEEFTKTFYQIYLDEIYQIGKGQSKFKGFEEGFTNLFFYAGMVGITYYSSITVRDGYLSAG